MKRIITTMLVMVMLLSMATMAYAEEEMTYGEILMELGFIAGNGNGADEWSAITREQVVVMLNKLYSNEDAGLLGGTKSTFTDAKIPEWAIPHVEYARSNNLTSGKGNNLFGYGEKVTYQEAVAFVMNSLGEQVNWATVIEDAKATRALSSIAGAESTVVLREHVFELFTRTLLQTDTNGVLMLQKTGRFSQAQIEMFIYNLSIKFGVPGTIAVTDETRITAIDDKYNIPDGFTQGNTDDYGGLYHVAGQFGDTLIDKDSDFVYYTAGLNWELDASIPNKVESVQKAHTEEELAKFLTLPKQPLLNVKGYEEEHLLDAYNSVLNYELVDGAYALGPVNSDGFNLTMLVYDTHYFMVYSSADTLVVQITPIELIDRDSTNASSDGYGFTDALLYADNKLFLSEEGKAYVYDKANGDLFIDYLDNVARFDTNSDGSLEFTDEYIDARIEWFKEYFKNQI